MAIVDDQKIVTSGITYGFSRHDDIEVVGAWCTVDHAIEQILAAPPDVVVLDLQMGYQSGLDVARTINERAPDVKIVCLSGWLNPEYIAGALAVGAHGYVEKSKDFDLLVEAVRRASRGERTWCKEATAIASALCDDDIGPLTEREREVLRMAAGGVTTQAIARRLGVGRATVRKSLDRVEAKLGIHKVPPGYRVLR